MLNFTRKSTCMRILMAFAALFIFSGVVAQFSNRLIIGTYTQTGSEGIYVAEFDPSSGKLSLLDSISANNPSYLCIAPNGRNVYAVSETAADKPGSVLAFDFNASEGRLKLLNVQGSGGDHPCFISMDAMGRYVVVANYSGGSLSILPVNKMGTLKPAVQVIQRRGSGPNTQRQEKSHVHQVFFAPKQKHVVVADLGTDEVVAYPFDPKKPQPLDTNKVKRIKLEGGAGPRHAVFHPTKPIFYVIEELSGQVSVHAFNKKSIAKLQTVVSDTISRQSGSADIHISPDGRFLYASNRADANNICIFSIRESDGRLERIGCVPVQGLTPRNFVIHPSGQWLLVANQQSNQVVVFERDPQSGWIRPNGQVLNLPAPVCLVFSP